jgi:hypothetical protein
MKKTTSLDYFKDKWTPIEYAKKGKKSGKKGNDDDNVNKNALLKGKCLS